MNRGQNFRPDKTRATTENNSRFAMITSAKVQLRNAGLRVTPVRIKVLATLLAERRALSHQDIQERFLKVDRVTLYRVLDSLISVGLAHKIAGFDRVFRYNSGAAAEQVSPNTESNKDNLQHQHGHFKCTRCTKIFCFSSSNTLFLEKTPSSSKSITNSTGGLTLKNLSNQLRQALQEMLDQGFQGHKVELTINGWCIDCTY
jgi:Fur family ferric uptake transcriptional regulator